MKAIIGAQATKGQQNHGKGLSAGPAHLPITTVNDGVTNDLLEDS